MCQTLRAQLTERLKPIHRKFRARKIQRFLRLVAESRADSCLLDVGGGTGVGGEFLGLYVEFSKVIVVNLGPVSVQSVGPVRPEMVVADGRCLPFKTGSCDWVFSNAVIEHVGDWADQRRFADEIRRVASRGYFVTTPNRYFPLEPHTLLPLYQFLPARVQRKVAPYCPGYLRRYEVINLLSAAQMGKLFPEAEVFALGLPGLGPSLVAQYRRAS